MKEYNVNPFEIFNEQWAIVTAGTKDNYNSMTISWGSMGTLWHKNIVTIYIRPDRYTFKFLEDNDIFTLSFYDEEYRNELSIFGRTSGRDVDKVKESGFTPEILDNGITYKEAKQTIVLKKIYIEQMNKELFDKDALECYKDNAPAHYMIIGEIVNIVDKKRDA